MIIVFKVAPLQQFVNSLLLFVCCCLFVCLFYLFIYLFGEGFFYSFCFVFVCLFGFVWVGFFWRGWLLAF